MTEHPGRAKWPDLPPEKADARYEAVMAAMTLFADRLEQRLCVACGTKVETYEQAGRCVYADPCGHRQYQGKVPE